MNVQLISGSIGTINELRGEKTDEKDSRSITFSVATERYSRGKGRDKDGNPTDYVTTWHDCLAFGFTAQRIADKFRKGNVITIKGYLDKSQYFKKDSDGNATDEKAWSVKTIVEECEGPTARVKNDVSEESAPAEKPAPAAKPAQKPPASAQKPAARTAAPAAKPAARPAPKQTSIDDDIPF